MAATQRYQTKRDYVIEVLRERIAGGRLRPGEPLRPEQLAEQLGVSQTPVREALSSLVAEGLLAYAPHRGVTVNEYAVADVRDLYLMRAALEGLAGRLALERADPEERAAVVERMESIQREMATALAECRLADLPALNRRFHAALYEASGSERVLDAIARLLNTIPTHSLWLVPGMAERLVGGHQRLLQAVRAGDPEAVRRVVAEHVEAAAAWQAEAFQRRDGHDLAETWGTR